MNRFWEVMRCFMLREQLVSRFEREVTKGKAFSLDLALKKGGDYVIRGGISKGRGAVRMTLGDPEGHVLPLCGERGGWTCLALSPERSGSYKVWFTVRPADPGEAVRFTVGLYAARPIPKYLEADIPDGRAVSAGGNAEPVNRTGTGEAIGWREQGGAVKASERCPKEGTCRRTGTDMCRRHTKGLDRIGAQFI